MRHKGSAERAILAGGLEDHLLPAVRSSIGGAGRLRIGHIAGRYLGANSLGLQRGCADIHQTKQVHALPSALIASMTREYSRFRSSTPVRKASCDFANCMPSRSRETLLP